MSLAGVITWPGDITCGRDAPRPSGSRRRSLTPPARLARTRRALPDAVVKGTCGGESSPWPRLRHHWIIVIVIVIGDSIPRVLSRYVLFEMTLDIFLFLFCGGGGGGGVAGSIKSAKGCRCTFKYCNMPLVFESQFPFDNSTTGEWCRFKKSIQVILRS